MQTPSQEEVAAARRIMVWKDFVPQPLRFPLILLIIVVYMFSGGVYMSAVSEMAGSLSWINEDVMMAGYASMTGLTMAFDYIGGVLWSLFLLCIVFVFVYGDHYDWLDSDEIRIGILFAFVLLAMALHRASAVRHPYISIRTFSQHNMLYIFILFGCMTLMSATATSTQNIFTGQILGYDARHNADLNWSLAAGIAVGTALFYFAVTRWKWRVKSVLLTGFVSFLLYQVSLYFLIDPSVEKHMLYLPVLFKGAGVSLVYTSLT